MANPIRTLVFIVLLAALQPMEGARASITVSEILYRPAAGGTEFIELFNPDAAPADMAGWRLEGAVRFQFPPGAALEPGGYAVAAASPAQHTAVPAGAVVWGPFDGKLDNNGETIDLFDSDGELADRVSYLPELGWPPEADGFGPSLERVHPQMPPNAPQSWSAGPSGGTPGAPNAAAIESPLPVVLDVRQSPSAPTSSQPVRIECAVVHNRPPVSAHLRYRLEGEAGFQTIAMRVYAEEPAGKGIRYSFTAEIPPMPDNSLVEFYIEAAGPDGSSGLHPFRAIQTTSIYRVDDNEYRADIPLYRIVMRSEDEQRLRSRPVWSNEELGATFIAGDEAWHNVGVRFRGKGSRNAEPKSYRVDFTRSRYFGAIRKLNLNAHEPDRQWIGLEAFKRLRLPAPEKSMAALVFNRAFVPRYIQVERTDRQMMARVFGDGSGNLYRGEEQANLDYRGENPDAYRPHYAKETNEREDDYTDVIRLCEAFSAASDERFPRAVTEWINVRQWIRWFALKQVLNDLEGGLSKERGDDYYIYRNPADGLFHLLPWDQDSVITEPFLPVHHHQTPAVQRLLRHPAFAPMYYGEILSIVRNELTMTAMEGVIQSAAPLSTPQRMDYFRQTYAKLLDFNYRMIPRELTVNFIEREGELELRGRYHAALGREVRVNGEFAQITPWMAEWVHRVQPFEGKNCFTVESVNAEGQVFETLHTDYYHNAQPPGDGVELCPDTVWTAEDNPIVLTQNVIVPENARLAIRPGARILLATGVSLVVFGELGIEGTETGPVSFEPAGGGGPDASWGALVLDSPEGVPRIAHARFTGAAGATFRGTAYPAAVSIRNGTLTADHCDFESMSAPGIDAAASNIAIRNCAFRDTAEGIHALDSYAVVDSCEFTNILGYNDAIDFDGQMGPPSLIRRNRIDCVEDDGIDTGYASVHIEANRVLNCADKGLSLEGRGSVSAWNNVIDGADTGVAVKDGCVASLIHNTILNCAEGVSVYEKNPGAGGASAELINTLIWNAETSVKADDLSVLTLQASNANPPPGPPASGNYSFDPRLAEGADDPVPSWDSPLIDKGIETGVTRDIAGNPRSMGLAPDIGAFEHDPSTPVEGWELYR